MPHPQHTFTSDGLDAVRTRNHRPLLFTGAVVRTADPLIGTLNDADVLLVGDVIVGVGPGIVTAAEDDDALVVDARGTVITPAVLDGGASLRPRRGEHAGTLAPGAPADLVVLSAADAPSVEHAVIVARDEPARVLAVIQGGEPVLWAGVAVASEAPGSAPSGGSVPDRVGTWIDERGFLHQHLDADGRYDETRGGREHAFQGSYWIDGDRIDYLDDLGFWAFGRFDGPTLHHAGYIMHMEDNK